MNNHEYNCKQLEKQIKEKDELLRLMHIRQKWLPEKISKLEKQNAELELEVERLRNENEKLQEYVKEKIAIEHTGVNWNPYDASVPDPCKNCNQHPKNGGNGICHCTLGSQVTY